MVSKAGDRTIEAEYSVPFLYHAALEPIAITGQKTGNQLEVWGGMQDPLATRAKLARLAGLSAIGGAFGRRLPGTGDQHLSQIVALTREMDGVPVKLIWSREEDLAQGVY